MRNTSKGQKWGARPITSGESKPWEKQIYKLWRIYKDAGSLAALLLLHISRRKGEAPRCGGGLEPREKII